MLILGSFLALSALALEGEVVSGNITDAKMELETLNDSMASLQMDFIIQMDKTDASVETTTTPVITTTPTTTTTSTSTTTTTEATTTPETTTTTTTPTTTTTTSTSTTTTVCGRNSDMAELQPLDALMSSSAGNFPAENCIDGEVPDEKKKTEKEGLCHSKYEEPAPWFAIDYGDESRTSVGKLVLNNRAKCCGHRTANVEIRMADELPADGNSMFKGGHVISTYEGPGENGEVIEIKSNEEIWEEIVGRYLIIQMDHTADPEPINLQEITVYGKQCE